MIERMSDRLSLVRAHTGAGGGAGAMTPPWRRLVTSCVSNSWLLWATSRGPGGGYQNSAASLGHSQARQSRRLRCLCRAPLRVHIAHQTNIAALPGVSVTGDRRRTDTGGVACHSAGSCCRDQATSADPARVSTCGSGIQLHLPSQCTWTVQQGDRWGGSFQTAARPGPGRGP